MPIPMIPLLADFAIRLACGLALLLLATPWRIVPPSFFRTHSQIILGLLVLAALDMSRTGVNASAGVVIGAAVLGYLATITWGLGLPVWRCQRRAPSCWPREASWSPCRAILGLKPGPSPPAAGWPPRS